MKYLPLAALVLAVFVQTGRADETALAPDNSAVDWQLLIVDGQPVDYTATLNLGALGRVAGQAPCNRYFADLNREGVLFKLGAIGATKMACSQMKAESDFFQMLQGIEFGDQGPAQLILTGGGHVMVFEQVFD